jgi:hypothetical protein
MAASQQIQSFESYESSAMHYSAVCAKGEARSLLALMVRKGVTVEEIREIIAVPLDVERMALFAVRKTENGASENYAFLILARFLSLF